MSLYGGYLFGYFLIKAQINRSILSFIQNTGEECAYSSDLNHSDGQNEHSDDDYDLEDAPTIILNPPCGANDRGNFVEHDSPKRNH